MAVRAQYEGSNEVGVFAKLTNRYCLTSLGGSENFYRWAPPAQAARLRRCPARCITRARCCG